MDKGLLTINNVSNTDDLTPIKILDVYYNETSNVVTYEFTYHFKQFLAQSDIYKTLTISDYYNLTSGDITSGSTQTTSTLDKLVSKYTTYLYTSRPLSATMSISEKTATAELDSGVYLIIPSSTERVYAVMVGNLTPIPTDGTWQIADATINAKVSDPTVIKYIGKIGEVSGSYSIGDEVPCIMVATVPLFPTNASKAYYLLGDVVDPIFELPTFEKFTVKDGDKVLTTQSDGTVTDENGNIVATILIPDPTWSESLGGTVVTIQIATEYLTSNVVTVNYSLILNENAVVSTSGNQNMAGLVMKTRVYSDSDIGLHPYYTYTTIYTYGIDLLAYKKGDKSTVLSDMTFDVYKDSALTQKVGTITTDSSGKGTLAGVAEGTYYIKNTKTVSGYNLATTTAMKVKISGAVESDTDGYYKVEIEVPEISALPLTGGKGTIIYIGTGLLIILFATITYTITSKKKQLQN